MIVLDASVAIKWFVRDEPLTAEAGQVLDAIELDPSPYSVPDFFMNELLAVLCRLPASRPAQVQEALALVEALGITRVGNGHELLALAADFASRWKISGYDAVYVALAALSDGVWLTADARAARRVGPGESRRRRCGGGRYCTRASIGSTSTAASANE